MHRSVRPVDHPKGQPMPQLPPRPAAAGTVANIPVHLSSEHVSECHIISSVPVSLLSLLTSFVMIEA